MNGNPCLELLGKFMNQCGNDEWKADDEKTFDHPFLTFK